MPGHGQIRHRSALLLNVVAGFDARDATSLDRQTEDYTRDLERPIAGLRALDCKEFFSGGLAPQNVAALR
jgi:aspartyl-tRNA(Asn)/glutamyl-tRNA(Gln) amidotransferase subunit A